MNKLIRASLALVSFALCSVIYAGSADLYVETGSITISIGGTTDANITIVNLDTNETVASVSALTSAGGSYNTNYLYYADTYVPGVSVTAQGYTTQATVTGLSPGNYRVVATAWQMSDFTSNSGGNWAEISLYDPYFGSAWMDFYFGSY